MASSLKVEDYTVGWIAPLAIERAAVEAMFDEEHDVPEDFEQPRADPNSYSWGKIGNHNIVLASLEEGVDGTASAASSATSLLRSFPEIRFGLLVGIGGAIPRDGNDIRLGDIVVSRPSGNTGGVVQYDHVRSKPGGRERKDFLNAPPGVLLRALVKLRSRHERAPSQIKDLLQDMEKRNPFMFQARSGNPGYKHPDKSKDRLFRPTYPHQNGSDCRDCAREQEVQRDPREDENPVIHYGVIASGNTLVKDALAREELLQHIPDDCLCYEMEAAGLMNNFPCLVIRGISDYSDSHKNDDWQRYASATAAAFAKELLEYVPADKVHREEKALVVVERIRNIEADVSDTKQAAVSLRNRRDIDDIIAWLSPVNVQVSHKTACNMRFRGTCTWFLQGEVFQSWKRCHVSFLWVNGIVGCGKTVLSSAIIENLKAEEKGSDCMVLYFYFGSDSTHDCLDGMVRAFLSQIITATSEIPKNLWDRYQTCKQQSTHAGTQSLLDDFRLIVSSLDEIKIVLDALDEVKSESREGILTWIKESFPIQKNEGSCIGLIALSRQEPIFQLNFKNICREVQISRSDVDRDIQQYVQGRLKAIQKSQGWELFSHETQQVEDVLLQKAHGMFRLAAVQIDSLRDCDTLDGLQQDLQSLPTTLTKMYDKIIEDISPKRKSTAIRLLQLLAYAERPLRLDEVAAAILFDFSKTPGIVSSNKLLQKNNLPNYCPSLVLLEEVDNPDYAHWRAVQKLLPGINKFHQRKLAQFLVMNKDAESRRCWYPNMMLKKSFTETVSPPSRCTIVRLAHFSVKEYLRCGLHHEFEEQYGHSIILKLSLGYLKSLSTILPDAPSSTVRKDYPFSDYASSLWPKHAKACEKDQNAQDLIIRFLTDLQALRTWISVFNPQASCRYLRFSHAAETRLPESSDEIPTPLQIATTFGLGSITKALLDSGVSLSEQHTSSDSDKYDNQVLQAFYSKGLLYDNYLRIPDGPILRTGPLYIACHHGWEGIVMLLLEKGLHLHDHTGPRGSPFTAACEQGHKALVHLLVDIESSQIKDGSHRDLQVTKLFIYGHWKSLKILLDLGVVFPPSTTDCEVSKVFKDSESVDVAEARLMNLILEMTSWTKCLTGSNMVDRVLLAKSTLLSLMEFAVPFLVGGSQSHLVDVIIQSDGAVLGTELHEAVLSGDIAFLRAVLPRWKSLFRSCDQRGKSPLHLAAEVGHVEIIEILVSAGFSLDITDNSANRPLSFALMNRQIHVLHLLSPDQDSIEQERSRLQKQVDIITAIDMEDFPKLKDIYSSAAQASLIFETQVSKSAFRHAVLNNCTAISNFMLSNGPHTPTSWSPIGLEAYACAIKTENFDFVANFYLDKDAEFEFQQIYSCSPSKFAQRNGSPDIACMLDNQSMYLWE